MLKTSMSQQSSPVSEEESSALESGGIYWFDHDHDLAYPQLVEFLGGKGAGLAEMSRVLGLSVPPGFTVAVPMCQQYFQTGWPTGLDQRLKMFVAQLGERMGRALGDRQDPLLVSVRSGAPVSMPGMMDTILNVGLNDHTVLGLAAVSGDETFAWDSYHRFLTMFAVTVMGVDGGELAQATTANSAPAASPAGVSALQQAIVKLAGRPVPADPVVQLRQAVEAVFASWNSSRAQAYREREGIDANLGTAVIVQAMVFGNRGQNSGTGVVFTRDPSSGANEFYGDYLPCAQGEDVVAGTAQTLPIAELGILHPKVYTQLCSTLRKLEIHYRDMCDVEFTIEDGTLWLLQTRSGKRSARATVKIAMDMTMDPKIVLMPDEVMERAPARVRARARLEALAQGMDEESNPHAVTKGLGASPGRATGRVVLTSDEAADAEDDVILVRNETSPEDVAGMAASVGLLTTRGGLVSHAAVVARGWGIPAVVGAQELTLDESGIITPQGDRIDAGETITIDGTTGGVWRGEVTPPASDEVLKTLENELPELLILERWASSLDH